ncbi:hypothetical protein RBH76_05910 [Oscillospiraceae bacterium MB24-C1]|nr:hypothetical protein RBH76_05910 [Oscillospiraceae bacterium MB24-C1]
MYVAVQLLEQHNTLDLAALQQAAERVEGSFTFTILDVNGTLSFIKGTSPLVIYRSVRLHRTDYEAGNTSVKAQ